MLFRSRLTLIAALGCVALAGSGCGRRGALQSPPDASAAPRASSASTGSGLGVPVSDPGAVADGDDLDPAGISGIPQPTVDAPVQTTKGAKRGYVIPKKPFILDPLL